VEISFQRENLHNYLFVRLHMGEMGWIVEMYGQKRGSGSIASATKLPRKRSVFYLLWMNHESRIFKLYCNFAIIMHSSSSFQIRPRMSEGRGGEIYLKSAQKRAWELIKSSRYPLKYLDATFSPRYKYSLAYCRLEDDRHSTDRRQDPI
jgi:hypothetical protein